ncbi:hypothetical protein CBL_20180 [Carabus blaptoides fortunei]
MEKTNKQPDAEWKISETKVLLDKYENYLSQVGPMKKFKTKRIMWKKISADLKEIFNVEKTDLQCENRYKTILKRKKKAVDNNHRSGSSRETIEYEEEIRKISAIDDSLEPEVLRGVTQLTSKETADIALEDGNTSSETGTGQEEPANPKKNGKQCLKL